MLRAAEYNGRPPGRETGSRQPCLFRPASSCAGAVTADQPDPDGVAAVAPALALALALAPAPEAAVGPGGFVSVPNCTCTNASSLVSRADVSKTSRRSGTIVCLSSQNRAARLPSARCSSTMSAGLPTAEPVPW